MTQRSIQGGLWLIWFSLIIGATLLTLQRTRLFIWWWESIPVAITDVHPSGHGPYSYVINLDTAWMSQDETTDSPAQLLEDGIPLPHANMLHADIGQRGNGRFSFWKGALYFSTSDNSDPRANGRRYKVLLPNRHIRYRCVLASWIGVLAWMSVLVFSRRDVLGLTWKVFHPLMKKQVVFTFLLAAIVLVTTLFFTRIFTALSGVLLYGFLMIYIAGFLLLCRTIHSISGNLRQRPPNLTLYANLIVLVCSIGLMCIGFEWYLQRSLHQSASSQQEPLTMPEEWQHRPVDIEGATVAYYWQGKLHVHNSDHMRRTQPFPPRKSDVARLMVVGDSLTYGYGVEEYDTYSAVIETALSEDYQVEVLNLGISGDQSEDALRIVQEFTPRLQPDLILYGVCLNDFLDSGEGEATNKKRFVYQIPLPPVFKRHIIDQTLVGKFLEKRYDELLMRIGLRMDFFDDILKDFEGYQARFGRDVRAMNSIAVGNGLPPIIGMVLDQYPRLDGRGHHIARIAEKLMQEAGMTVIATEEYYAQHNGKTMKVSRWEGHPNEEAHRIFAGYFVEALQNHPALAPYKIR